MRFNKVIYYIFFLLSLLRINYQAFAEAKINPDSLIGLLPSAKDTVKVQLLLDIANIYSRNDLNKSLVYARQALTLSEDLKEKRLICRSYNSIALALQQQGDADSAIIYFNKSLEILNSLDNKPYKEHVEIVNGMGMAYYDKNNSEKALLCYMEMLNIVENKKDSLRISKAYNNIANVLYQQLQFKKALEYHFKSLEIGKKLENKTMIAGSYNNIGIIYKELKQYEKALEYCFNTLEIAEEIGHKLGMSYTLVNIAGCYKEMKQFDPSLKYYQKALNLKTELGDKNGEAVIQANIGELYLKLNQPLKAMGYIDRSIETGLLLNSVQNLITGYKYKSDAYADLGDYKNAYIYIQKYRNLRDSIFSAESEERITKITAQYEADKKDKDYAILSQQNKIVTLASNKQKMLIVFLCVVVILLFIMGITAYYRFHEKKKTAETLEKLSIVASKTDNYVSITDKDDIISWTNDGFTRITGYDSEEVKNKSLPALLRGPGTDTETIKRIVERKNAGKPFSEEILNYRKDGTPVWLSFNVSPIVKENGVVEKYIAIGSDITEKKKAEEQLKFFAQSLEEKNKSINDSIRYASKIQTAILPPSKQMQEALNNHFILYKPKDIVSGDFYWIEQKDDIIYFAVVDCTGHGVPGALMSIIGFNSLNKIVRENLIYSPANILDKLSDEVESILRQKELSELKDGMDIALCMYDTKTMELEYAGANNPLYIVRSVDKNVATDPSFPEPFESNLTARLYEIKADRQPIGIFEERKQFTNNKLKLLKGDSLYIFSDGFSDQFGGPKAKKFQYRQLKEVLLKINDKDMPEQKMLLESTYYDWKGNHEQIDDVCVLGIKI